MHLLETIITTATGAVSATTGVVVGGLVTRRGQDRQWLRDKQLSAYADLLEHYAKFTMELKRAHGEARGWDYDWGAWSAALVQASLVAPPEVAASLDLFGQAIDAFLDAVARQTDPALNPLTTEQFDEASQEMTKAQLRFVNEIRRSVGHGRKALPTRIGGSPIRAR